MFKRQQKLEEEKSLDKLRVCSFRSIEKTHTRRTFNYG